MKKFKVGDSFIGFAFKDRKFLAFRHLSYGMHYNTSMNKLIGKVGVIQRVHNGGFSVKVYFPEVGEEWTYPINQKGLPDSLYNPKHIFHYKKV